MVGVLQPFFFVRMFGKSLMQTSQRTSNGHQVLFRGRRSAAKVIRVSPELTSIGQCSFNARTNDIHAPLAQPRSHLFCTSQCLASLSIEQFQEKRLAIGSVKTHEH